MLGIIGRGAVGSLLSGRAHHFDIPHVLLCRTPVVDPLICKRQLSASERWQPAHILPGGTSDPELSILLVPTKAYDVVTALRQWRHCTTTATVIVLLNNGMGPHETVKGEFPSHSIAAVTTNYGALKVTPNEVHETGTGPTAGGWLHNPTLAAEQGLKHLFNTLLPPFQWHPSATPALWQKLSINSVINPLTAWYNTTNGELAHPRFRGIISALITEFVAVARCCEQHFDHNRLQTKVYKVIRATADNYSSMRQDVRLGRRTEIDFINGYLLQQAASQNVAVPEHSKLYQQIKRLEG